jgi:hypothetical protein
MTENTLERNRAKGVWPTLIDMFTSPKEAFDSVAAAPRPRFPLAFTLLTSLIATSYYFSILDLAWWIDDTLRQSGATGEDLEAARMAMGSMTRTMMLSFGVVSTLIGTLLFVLIEAVYLSLAGALMGSDYKFRHWFGLASWAGTPFIVSAIAILVNVSLHPGGQLSSFDLDPTTLAAMGLTLGETYEPITSSISLPMLWAMALTVIGFGQWQRASLAKASLIVLGPYVAVLAAVLAFSS